MSDCTISLSGLSDNDAAAFEAAVGALPDDTWQIVSGMPATLLIVDIDTLWGHMDWLRATANGQPVAAFTREAQVRNCDLVLHKPLELAELTSLLARVEDSEHTVPPPPAAATADDELEATRVDDPDMREAATEPPVPVVATPDGPAATGVLAAEAVASASVTPEPRADRPGAEPAAPVEGAPPATLGACLLAGSISQPMTIRSRDGIGLTLDPERGGYTGSSLLKPLAPLLRLPMAQATPLDAQAIERLRRAPALPLTRLLWFAALTANPGHLAPTLDPRASYHLERWPQIEREFPRHFRIATAMMRGPGTLDAIAGAANAPVADVADFINAYSVAGYVSCNVVAGAPPPAATGMFSRLRRPFSRGGPGSG